MTSAGASFKASCALCVFRWEMLVRADADSHTCLVTRESCVASKLLSSSRNSAISKVQPGYHTFPISDGCSVGNHICLNYHVSSFALDLKLTISLRFESFSIVFSIRVEYISIETRLDILAVSLDWCLQKNDDLLSPIVNE